MWPEHSASLDPVPSFPAAEAEAADAGRRAGICAVLKILSLGRHMVCLTSVRTFHTVRNILTAEFVVITSKLTSKSQTTIPQPIRAALKLQEGDELVYEIRGQHVVLTKARQDSHADDPFQTFSEWNSAADKKAYADL
jgi:antitoxin PrlF